MTMTDDLRARLEEDHRIIDAATGGPWEWAEAVMKEHRKVPLNGHEDDCTNTDEEHREEHIQSDDDGGEFYCHELIEDWTCAECADVQDVASLAGPPEWPCPTVRTLTDKLTGEDDE